MNNEPAVILATVRESTTQEGFDVLDIECRFMDGQKFAAVQVDSDFPELAKRIADFLSGETNAKKGAK